ncbi:MAG: lysylphosphatidylglycerol synthase transmembrane domain-containing protein [Chloroflexota bacterium]
MTEYNLAKSTVALPEEEANEGAEPNDINLSRRFFNWKTLASFVVGFAIIYFMMRNVKMDLGATLATMRQANPWYYLIGFVIYYAGFAVRGWRWQRMLENAHVESETDHKVPPVGRLAQIIYVSWFANCVVPAKLGDVVRGYMLKHDANVRFMKGMGTIVAERILDLAMLLVLLGISGYVSMRDKLPEDVTRALELGFVLVGVAALALLGMRQMNRVIIRFVPEHLRERYVRFQEGTLRSFKSLPFISSLTLVVWVIEASRLLFVTWSLGVRMSDNLGIELLMVAFIALASAALTALPVTPGGLGLVEALIVKAFAWSAAASGVQVANEVIWSIAILDRSISYGSLVVFGLIVYLFSRRK